MRKKDTSDVMLSVAAVIIDAIAIFSGFMIATWLRFTSPWFQFFHAVPPPDYLRTYTIGAIAAAIVFLFVFRSLGLYIRPQIGRFENKIPRIIRATGIGIIVSIVIASAAQNFWFGGIKVSSMMFLISFVTISITVLLERYIVYRIEWNLARHSKATNRVLILGTDSVAAHIKRTLKKEAMLRSKVVAFLRTDLTEPDKDIPAELVKGTIEELNTFVADNDIDQIILSSPNIGHSKIVEIILLCEQNLITFNMVPDLFRVMTSSMDVQSIDDIPLLGVSQWPLDNFWNRLLKRIEDIIGSLTGLILSAPIIAFAALAIRRDSPGPVFFRQKRCGESGKEFDLIKLRTMKPDAEKETGPVWASEDDPRRTRIGSFLRKYNIDELPQFWNVLKGEMSLIGPRPERPHFVEQFKGDIGRYMWRHVSKPGMTGWAQVNGLRGNTSLDERIKYDLYYLENWSIAFDFKILLMTFNARENAY